MKTAFYVVAITLLCLQAFVLGATVDLMRKGSRIVELETDNHVKQAQIDLLRTIIDPKIK